MVPMSLDKIDLAAIDFLVIDDNKFIRRLLKEILYSFGARRVREVVSADDAFVEVRKSPPDVILCDWMMHPVNGLTFLKWVREQTAMQRIPVIMITGHATSDYVETALGEGADSYIAKPFTPATLLAHIVKIVEASAPAPAFYL
jgi:two-component system chemotaxis response regulator CheY